jgi:hypothetical protein
MPENAMTDFHENVFYYYRGSRQSRPDQYDEQLEDNTTKALVNTLQHCGPVVALKFLAWLGVKATEKVGVQLQRTTIGNARIHRASQRLLLGLVGDREPSSGSNAAMQESLVDGDSRPDAWLYGEDFVVLIESKVGAASLKPSQMQAHLRKLRPNGRHRPRCLVRTWAEVHQFFATCLPDLSGKDKWLVEQFNQYLEWEGMTEFAGFEEWMFEFFVREEKDAEEKRLIRRTMERFGEKVLDSGLRAVNPSFYEEPYVGKLSAEGDHFWVAFGPAGGPMVFGKKAHQTISLYDFGLDVFVNVEKQLAIKMLRRRILNDKQGFIDIVSGLPAPFSAWVEQKKPRKDRPMTSDYFLIARLEGGSCEPHHRGFYGLKDPTSSAFDYLVRLLEEIRLPYLSVRRRIERKRVLGLSRGGGKALVAEVVKVMKAFNPLVEFING